MEELAGTSLTMSSVQCRLGNDASLVSTKHAIWHVLPVGAVPAPSDTPIKIPNQRLGTFIGGAGGYRPRVR